VGQQEFSGVSFASAQSNAPSPPTRNTWDSDFDRRPVCDARIGRDYGVFPLRNQSGSAMLVWHRYEAAET